MSECATPIYRSVRGFIPAHTISCSSTDSPILVALSGGADSSLLLTLCVSYAKENPHKIYAAHVNHCIRGADADADEAFCAELCKKLGVEFLCLRADVPKLAKESGESIEGAARRIRYDFFSKIMREKDIKILATAHNADDNLETQIFNLARGAGLSGLSGIPRTRECDGGVLTRPILDLTKREVLELCKKFEIPFVTDKTNSDTEYSRNLIRATIIPELQKLTPSPQAASLRCADALREDEKYLTLLAESFLKDNSIGSGVCLKALSDAPQPIKYRAIKILASKAARDVNLESVHYDAIFELAKRAEPHSRLDLPKGLCATVEHASLIICPKETVQKIDFSFEQKLAEGILKSEDGQFLILVQRKESENNVENEDKFKNIYNLYTEFYLNFATIKGCLFFRTKKESDVILCGGMHKKLRKLFGEKGLSQSIRSRLPLLCDGEGIVWAPFCASRDKAQAKRNEGDLKISLFINDFLN